MDRPGAALTLQQLVGAAERLQRDAAFPALALEDWLSLVEDTRDRLLQSPFRALPLDGFVRDDDPKHRVIASPRPGDRLLEEAIRPALDALFLRDAPEAVHGYVRGRSTYTAAKALATALGAGHVAWAMLDIEDCFGSVDLDRLDAALAADLSPALRTVIFALLRAPVRVRGRETATRGLPLGRGISPVLANLHLRPLDAAMTRATATHGGVYLRYADDLFVAASDEAIRGALEAAVEDALGGLGMRLKAAKTRRGTFTGDPITYLGHAVDPRGVYERVSDARLERIAAKEPAPPQPSSEAGENRRFQTLYITEPGLYLKLAEGMVVVKRGNETVREVALHRLDRVLVLASGSFSGALLAAFVEARVPVSFFVHKGAAYGTLVSGATENPMRLRAQYDLLREPGRRLALARDVVRAKIRAMLRRLQSLDGAEPLRERLVSAGVAVGDAPDVDALRGVEGEATRTYYEGFARRIKREGFAFHGRSRRPPRDAINSLLSFAYSLLFDEMQTALLAHGLDPHVSLVHELARGHPALASDLIEPYRALVADSFVLTLVNNEQVRSEGFTRQSDGGVYMTQETRRVVIDAFERFVRRPAGGAKGGAPPRRLIDAAARAMLRVVLGEAATLVLPLLDEDVVDDDHVREEVVV